MPNELSPNVGVSTIESMGFSAGDMLYRTMLRDVLIEKVNRPDNIWDDRVVAMADGAFGYKQD